MLAQFERELTSERLVANLEQVARDGAVIGPLPFGYRRVDGAVVIDEGPAEVVRTILREYATGQYSYRDLASWLNENGHRPPNFDGRHHNGRPHATVFVADALTDVIANARYAGRVVYRPRRNVGARGVAARFPAIIDEETWNACAAIRRRNAGRVPTTCGRTHASP